MTASCLPFVFGLFLNAATPALKEGDAGDDWPEAAQRTPFVTVRKGKDK